MTSARQSTRWLARLLKSGMTLVSAALLLLLVALGWLSGSESGSRWLLQTALSYSEQVSLAESEGTLLDQLTLRELHYRQDNTFSVMIDRVTLEWRPFALLQGHLQIRSLRLQRINIHGRPDAGDEESSGGALPEIPLLVSLDAFDLERLQWQDGDSTQKIDRLTFRAQLENNRLSLSELILALPQWRINGESRIQLREDWPVEASLDWLYRSDDASLEGHLSVNGNKRRFDIVSRIEGAAESRQTGYLSLAGAQPEFAINGDWQKLRWPLGGTAQVGSRQGDFRIEGTPQHYRIKLNAGVTVPERPDFSVVFSGQGDSESIDIEQLLLKPAQGRIELHGLLSWAGTVAFDLALQAERLEPVALGIDLPARLDLAARTQGKIAGDRYQAALTIEKLSGTLYDQPLKGGGKLKLENDEIAIDRFDLSAGRNRIRASGQMNRQRADITLAINAPNLRSIWPKLAGNLKGDAMIKGSLQHPIVVAKLKGKNLRYGNDRIALLNLTTDYKHQSSETSSLELSASDLQLADNGIERLVLQGSGTREKHRIRLELSSELANVRSETLGRWDGAQWKERFDRLDIEHPQLKRWQLQAPLLLTIDPQRDYRIDLANGCLVQNAAALCVALEGSPTQQLSGRFDLSDWPLAAAQPWLPEEMTLSGLFSLQGEFTSQPGEPMVDVKLQLPQGMARFKDEDGLTHEQTFRLVDSLLRYQEDKLTAQLRLELGQQNFIGAKIVAQESERDGPRDLDGRIQARIDNLRLIDGLLKDVNQLQGFITADLDLGGNDEKPILTGNMQWSNGQLAIPRLGSIFRNVTIQANSHIATPERLQLRTSLESGQGKLTGNGHLDLLPEQGFPLQFTLNGDRFQISRLPEAVIALSPDVQISRQGNLTQVKGLIKIDSAEVELKTIPKNAVTPSPDEVIVNTEQQRTQPIDPSRLNARLTIDFGDESRFEGFGLKTRVSGRLDYLMNEERQGLLGTAKMQDATYRAYGQDLTIRKGEFVFNGPTDNPWITIEAIRKAIKDDVTAVLRVTGPLKSPQTKVFTEPSLPESEALSYLVTGKSSQFLGKSEGNAVATAAFNYGAGQLSWLSDRLGIDEFEFEGGDTIEDSAVRLGQYINPDLYIGFTMGLFSDTYSADLKYRLNKNFSINTRAGDTQRIDLKYHLETD